MIEIVEKKFCSGCGACASVCPTQAISMTVDDEGFRYPRVDVSACISCSKCEKQCPFISPKPSDNASCTGFLLADDDEERRLRASSGGAFMLLATQVIEAGGIVFGATFDKDWNVCHRGVECIDDLSQLRGSKYVESNLCDSYNKVKEALEARRRVMFVGTPCQVAGLSRAVGKPHDNLLLVEVACHGVPSEKVWNKTLDEFCDREKIGRSDIQSIDFRDKVNGWKYYYFTIKHGKGQYSSREFPYILGFAYDLYLRPSCYACRVKEVGSYADITLADAWGIEQVTTDVRWLDDKGVNFVMAHTDKGRQAISAIKGAAVAPVAVEAMLQHNRSIVTSARPTPERGVFFALFAEGLSVERCVAQAHRVTWKQRLEKLLTPLLVRLGIKGFTKKLRRK